MPMAMGGGRRPTGKPRSVAPKADPWTGIQSQLDALPSEVYTSDDVRREGDKAAQSNSAAANQSIARASAGMGGDTGSAAFQFLSGLATGGAAADTAVARGDIGLAARQANIGLASQKIQMAMELLRARQSGSLAERRMTLEERAYRDERGDVADAKAEARKKSRGVHDYWTGGWTGMDAPGGAIQPVSVGAAGGGGGGGFGESMFGPGGLGGAFQDPSYRPGATGARIQEEDRRRAAARSGAGGVNTGAATRNQ